MTLWAGVSLSPHAVYDSRLRAFIMSIFFTHNPASQLLSLQKQSDAKLGCNLRYF